MEAGNPEEKRRGGQSKITKKKPPKRHKHAKTKQVQAKGKKEKQKKNKSDRRESAKNVTKASAT